MSSPLPDLAALRQAIARIEKRPSVRRQQPVHPTGLPALDQTIRGWPRPGVSEVTGRQGSGRLSLVLPAMAWFCKRGQPVAVVDPFGLAYPPGWRDVDLTQTLLLQPGPERVAWTAEQLAGSGSVPLVVLLDAPRLGRGGLRLQRAAERGGCAVVVLSERSERSLPAALRLELQGRNAAGALRLWIRRQRGGASGQRLELTLQAPGG